MSMLSGFGGKKPEKEGAASPGGAPTGAGAPLGAPPQPHAAASRSTAPSRPADRSGASLIGTDLTILGNLLSKGDVQVDGEVQGDVHAAHVVVGERACVTGGIVASEVVVRGRVMGSIRGKKVMLQSSSIVEGDVYHNTLGIEQGAFFEGKSRRSEDPTAGVSPLDVPKPGNADFGQRY
ncbi:MAG: bactofilin family protein [Hyphomicrobiaceae bacterium]